MDAALQEKGVGGNDLVVQRKSHSTGLAQRASPAEESVDERLVKKQVISIDQGFSITIIRSLFTDVYLNLGIAVGLQRVLLAEP